MSNRTPRPGRTPARGRSATPPRRTTDQRRRDTPGRPAAGAAPRRDTAGGGEAASRGRGTSYLKVVFSPGVVPGKWFARFDGRTPGWTVAAAEVDRPLDAVDAGLADVAIMRLPHADVDTDVHHRVVLYTETPGVAAPADHPVAVLDTVDVADLADETVLYETPADGDVDCAAVRGHLDVVAANVGVVVAPRPLLRAVNRRGVVHRDLDGVPGTRVAVVWRVEDDSAVIQDFVGVCRGRGEGSTRQTLARGARGGDGSRGGRGGDGARGSGRRPR
ncbi:LysR substrate-binding domain-containing protein [Corynebacterium bovis]|uniref:LysR substrate-binding domain-containing protein n=2 Tax=Corynebacterium bovis TaxID=36808 RepID=UPI003138B956